MYLKYFLLMAGIHVAGVSVGLPPSVLGSHLSPEKAARISEILSTKETTAPFKDLETEYQSLVNRRVIHDLLALYEAEDLGGIEITYASFTPEGLVRSEDKGFGLHVIKRTGIEIGNGRKRMVVVNEHWPENREDGSLFFPDELRIKTQIFEGDRAVLGSEHLYAFDSLRLGWGPSFDDVALFRRSQFERDAKTGGTKLKQMRVSVSAPYACQDCHEGDNSYFASRFLTSEGRRTTYEFIVQDSYFQLPLHETHGYREYVQYLERRKSPFLSEAKEDLLHPQRSMRLPGIRRGLKAALISGVSWLPSDSPFNRNDYPGFNLPLQSQGVYLTKKGGVFRDALENAVEEGKYRWWFPAIAVPSSMSPRIS